jgi:predicted aspartyl protease
MALRKVLGALFLLAAATSAPGPGRAVSAQVTDAVGQGASTAVAPRSITIPFTLDHNRMFVSVEFVTPGGKVRTARAWVDTGSEVLTLSEPLARELGLDLSGLKEGGAGHSVESSSPAPRMRLDGMPLDVAGIKVRVSPGAGLRPGVAADATLPASALMHDQVVLDYPARRLTVARPGTLKPRGAVVPCRVNARTGLFEIAAVLDGETVKMGVDTGSSGTWISEEITAAWRTRHPAWPHATGAAGSANFWGLPFETRGTLMRLSELRIGPLHASDVAVLGLPQDLFDWYSKKSACPVVGFIGANVLRGFRIEIDFPNGMTYWEAGRNSGSGDLDIVGLTLRPETGGGFTIAGVIARDGKPIVDGVRPGDTLLRVGSLDTSGAPMGAVEDALRGKPGEARTLVVERDGRRISVNAAVVRLP